MRHFNSLALLLIALASGLASVSAAAATYNLKQSVPPGCTQQGNNPVFCSNGLNLNWNDIIDASQVLVINVTGDVNLQNAQINMGSNAGVTINATGNITTGSDFAMQGSLNADGNVSFNSANQLIGNVSASQITTNSGTFDGSMEANQITLGYNTTVTGNLIGGTVSTNDLVTIGGSVSGTQLAIGGVNVINGNVMGTTITTAQNVTIGGSVSGTAVTLGSQNSVTGPVTGSLSVSLRPSGSQYGNNIISNGPVFIGSGNQVNGNISGTDITTDSPVNLTGNITATGIFDLASGSQVTGNVNAGSVRIRASNSDVTGDVTSAGNILIDSGSGITGSAVSGDTIELTDSDAYITENATATNEIIIGWAGSIGGDATAPTIQNNSGNPDSVGGDEFCDDSSSSHDANHAFACTAAPPDPGPGPGPSPGDQCELFNDLADYGIVGSNGFEAGNNSEINNNNIVGEGNTPTPVGQVDTIDLDFPPLNPAVFPTFSSPGTFLENETNTPPGTYGTIFTDKNNGLSSTSGGGTYYIDTISFSTNNNTLELGPGDYFVKNMILGNNSSINISPAGLVRIYVLNGITGGNDISFNTNGSVGNLVVYLYEGADFTVGNYCNGGNNCPEFTFNGLIYSPYATTDITFGNNTNFQGGALTPGKVEFGNNTVITYTPEVQAAVVDAAGCAPVDAEVHHYRLLHTTETVACYAAAVQVQACADATCSATFDDPVGITVTAALANSSWQGGDISSSSGTSANLNFSNGSGLAGLRNSSGGTAALTLSNATPTAVEATECYDLSGTTATSCEVTFNLAGLVIVGATPDVPLATQIAGDDFNSVLRAVRTNTTTGACEARLEGAQTVNLGMECLNPGACQAGQSYTINGTAIGLNNAGNVTNYAPLNVTFDANGNAPLVANNYSDVGLLRLHAELTLPEAPSPTEPGLNDPTTTLTGISINDFVVKPHTLVAAALTDTGTLLNASGAAPQPLFKRAGEPFNMVVQAQNSNGAVTPNFGLESPQTTVAAGFASMVFPNPAAPGSAASKLISGTFTLDTSNDGTFISSNSRWLEAGTFNAQAAAINYLGTGDALVRPEVAVGRFAPAEYLIDASVSMADNACLAGGFTYMSEPSINVTYRVQALNTLGSVTANYDTALYQQASAATAELSVQSANTSPADSASDAFEQRLNITTNNTWNNGVLEVNDSAVAFLRHPTVGLIDGPFASLRLGLQVANEGLDVTPWASSQPLITTQVGDAAAIPGVLNLRYGRTVLDDIFGPEGDNLDIVLQNQYFNGSQFVLNSDDSCFVYDAANLTIVADPANLNASPGGASAGTLINGEVPPGTWWWQDPGAVGEFIFEYDTQPWLEFDWNNDASLPLDDPTATAGFGQYRGNDRIIFWLERRN
ncbi:MULTISPECIES: polymer-forming cytoskeletal protein [Idiomarina]|uniref:polymer-forming cytoskeletal protein n=1 Tax=Idiomarina TaxID=135575 RepID=UPI00129D0EAA|nr:MULTISPECIES: polymer-forming cytoskeletal protein [Idiomarina]MRJ42035.1 hypothetical protein [Idiomarina sp. FeN1]NCU57318.1 hypothetical protein [Idiomarina sp. FenA--70]NCU60026.1 hypothetical protein [Idiomarina sp. FenBw--71]UUN12933.1 hypothetical protein KGF88_09800 [Idiomarina loihiensis]